MKMRHPLLIQAVSLVSAWIIRLWIGTLRYRYRPLGPNLDPLQRGMQLRCIYAFPAAPSMCPSESAASH
jgi:hypothetical protein